MVKFFCFISTKLVDNSDNLVYYELVNFLIKESLNQNLPEVTSQYQSDCYSLE
ncbi:MAG: hypothetical protein K8S23_04050 [Candidatus Cloacimonetes bacterium]|nr:hypothetical protein [Candidatus Cloacimonadota bacterium]